MGIQINGQTDTISATDGSFTISGASGDLIGNLTGNVTGNLTGTASTATAAATAYGLSGSPTLSGITSVSTTNLTVNGNAYPATGSLSNRNLIINGAMQVSQRSTSVIGVTGDGYYTVDRARIDLSSLGTYTVTQSTDAPEGFSNSFKVECTTAQASPAAGAYFLYQQRIEGQNLQMIKKGTSNAQQLTVSFWVKSDKTGTYVLGLNDRDNNRVNSKSYTISSANTWEYKTLTFEADTTGAFDNDNAESLRLDFWLASGSDFNSGTLSTGWETFTNANRAVGNVNLSDTVGNDWSITGVQLEVGSVATPFEHRSYGDELARCQRYCFKFGNTGSSANAYARFPMGVSSNTTTALVVFSHPVPMRDTARQMVFSASQIDHYAGGGITGSYTATITTDGNSDTSTMVTFTNIGTLVGDAVAPIRFYNDADAYVLFTAEI